MSENQPNFLTELKRRKVFRVAAGYIVIAWVALQFFDLVFDNIDAPDWVMQSVLAIMAVGFPIAVVLAWAFDVSPEGVRKVPGRNRTFGLLVAALSVASLGYVAWMFLGTGGDETKPESTASGSEIGVIDAIANDGFLYRDIFRLPPGWNPLITRLNDMPEYDEWLTEFSGRREQARGALVQMERDKVILAASDVAP